MPFPDTRLTSLFRTESPIVQAPMAGAMDATLVIGACRGGALGSLPCAMLTPDAVRAEVGRIRAATSAPFNLNFFCHTSVPADPEVMAAWKAKLLPFYRELGLPEDAESKAPARAPFDESMLAVVEETRPNVVSFHFGLPEPRLLEGVKRAGAVVLGCATTRSEALWLEERGVDAIIAQGVEAGGHRGTFLPGSISSQPGTFALVPEVVDSVRVPVIAAGGIADGRGIAAALALGASGVQIGTAYLKCPESKIAPAFRALLAEAHADSTVVTNAMTGRPARGFPNRIVQGIGALVEDAPAFPHAAAAIAPLRASAEKSGSGAFSPYWAGQGVSLSHELSAEELTRALGHGALARLSALARG
ncbi:MAG TPA: nitronate monooxygenase [Polyangiaceae bacterium]|nr:nitronate monooxygenase [Polyangiaceae bacterium]